MRRLIMPMVALCGLAAVTGCSGDETSPAAPHNVEYFKQHPDERAAVTKRCAQDQSAHNPLECDNAASAQRAVNMAKDLGQ